MYVPLSGDYCRLSRGGFTQVMKGGRLVISTTQVGPVANLDGLRSVLGRMQISKPTRKFLKM
jgi:hypothetical protein